MTKRYKVGLAPKDTLRAYYSKGLKGFVLSYDIKTESSSTNVKKHNYYVITIDNFISYRLPNYFDFCGDKLEKEISKLAEDFKAKHLGISEKDIKHAIFKAFNDAKFYPPKCLNE